MVSTPDKSHMQKNDPYRGMEIHQTRPDYVKQSAQESLKNAEKSAANSQKNISQNALKGEQSSINDSFRNRVKGRPNASRVKLSKKGFLKSKGPLAFISMILFASGALFFGGQSILGPHISSLYTQATDVQFTTYSLRNQRLFSFMLDGGEQIRTTAFSKKFTTFTPYMKSRLEKNNIKVGHLDDNGNFTSGDLLAGKSRVLQFTRADGSSEIINASDFTTKYAQDVNFREAYYKAKRGRVAGFFDDASDFVYKKLGLTRNIFDNFTPSSDPETDNRNFRETLGAHLGGTDTELNTVSHTTDDGGTPDDPSDDTRTPVKNGDDLNPSTVPGDTPETKARSFANSLTSKVSNSGGLICSALRVANLANIAAFAASTANSINYFMGLTENISKMMAGEGDASAINDTLNFFTTSTESKVEAVDENGNTTTTTVTGSMLESNGARIILGGVIPTPYETGKYSLETITSSAKRTALVGGGTAIGCSGAEAISAIVSIVSTGIPGGTLAHVVIGMLAETIGSIALTGIMASVISAIVPTIGRVLFTNVLDAYTGVPAGELFSQGAAASNAKVAQNASAYTPASAEAIQETARATSSVLALEAELDRNSRSPFDVTSQNTFLGSLATNLLSFSTSSSLAGPISIVGSLTSSALGNLLPTAFAADTIDPTYTTTFGDCETLDTIGVKGDIYCNAIMTPDLQTVNTTPDDSTYEATVMGPAENPNLNPEATKILDNSELAKFITFCAHRESPFGVTDANILNALQTDGGVILNNLPILNDVIDLVNAVEDATNLDWATGKACTNAPDNPRWEEFKYYQRYVEDTRILDQNGAFEEEQNPVLAYQEKYFSEHPLDNSREGYLARITGMTKNDIAFLFEFADYSEFLASYDPSSLYPVVATEKPTPQLSFDENSSPIEQGTAVTHALYIDTRNRNHAA